METQEKQTVLSSSSVLASSSDGQDEPEDQGGAGEFRSETVYRAFEGSTQGRIQSKIVDTTYEPAKDVFGEAEGPAPQRRLVGRALADNPRLVMTLLSFINKVGQASVNDLIEYGQRDILFEKLLDLYDVGLLKRDGARVSLTPDGMAILGRAGLV